MIAARKKEKKIAIGSELLIMAVMVTLTSAVIRMALSRIRIRIFIVPVHVYKEICLFVWEL